MKKKLISALLVLAIAVTLLSTVAFARDRQVGVVSYLEKFAKSIKDIFTYRNDITWENFKLTVYNFFKHGPIDYLSKIEWKPLFDYIFNFSQPR